MVIMVSGDEPDGGGDGGPGCPGGEGHHQMGERGGGLFGRAEGQLEQITQDYEIGGIIGIPQYFDALAQRGEDGGRHRGVDGAAVLRVELQLGQDAVEGLRLEVPKDVPIGFRP